MCINTSPKHKHQELLHHLYRDASQGHFVAMQAGYRLITTAAFNLVSRNLTSQQL